jgi:hypothetical protein
MAMKQARPYALLAAALLSLWMFGGLAFSQEPVKTLRDELVGPWRLVSIKNVRVDGSQYELFGPSARGMVVFNSDGTYSLQIIRAVRPLFASNDRMTGTVEENKAAVQGMISHFGTYQVSEPDHSILLRVEGSSYPNLDGTVLKLSFTLLGSRLTWSDLASPVAPLTGDLRSDLIWRREGK